MFWVIPRGVFVKHFSSVVTFDGSGTICCKFFESGLVPEGLDNIIPLVLACKRMLILMLSDGWKAEFHWC